MKIEVACGTCEQKQLVQLRRYNDDPHALAFQGHCFRCGAEIRISLRGGHVNGVPIADLKE